VTATVADLPQRVADENITPPALTIIGKVVLLRRTMNWFESRPLFGKTIVVTRTRQQASELSQQLSDLGARVIEAPTIELHEPDEFSGVDESLRSIESFDWVVFTSANGVAFTARRLLEIGLDARAFSGVKVAAIGDATARAIREKLCLKVDLCPQSFVAEALADALAAAGAIRGGRFLLLRADIARTILRERLEQGGAAEVRDVAIYETRPAAALPAELLEALETKEIHWITFTSSSTASNFVRLLGCSYREQLANVKVASIGPITSATLRELGLEPTIQADVYNISGLIESIRALETK
jgi:uroporphyrinogen III methyltransferase/synthase